MTNANVEQIGSGVEGRTLTLKYKDGEKKIFVSDDAAIVTYVPGDKSDLKAGAKSSSLRPSSRMARWKVAPGASV